LNRRTFRLAYQGEIRQNLTTFDGFRGMAEKNPEIRFTVSPTLYGYLVRLSEKTVLGKTPNDVAQQILTQQLALMRQENYAEKD
jgi:hypothetical protein